MKAAVLMAETFWRRSFIRVVHVAILGFFAALFLLPREVFGDWLWGGYIFGFGGLVLPLALATGIIGNDTSAGRFAQLLSSPVRFREIYLWRLAGLVVQGALHIAAAGLLILLLQAITGKGSVMDLGLWMLAGLLVFVPTAALTQTVSTFTPRSMNILLLVLAAIMALVMYNVLRAYDVPLRHSMEWTGRNLLPPVAGLVESLLEHRWRDFAWAGVHGLGLTCAYAAAGILILNLRQYGRASE